MFSTFPFYNLRVAMIGLESLFKLLKEGLSQAVVPAGGIQFRKSIFVFCESDSVGCRRQLFVCDEDFSAAGP